MINGVPYRELALRCFGEGYDAAQLTLNEREGEIMCPYGADGQRYERAAWESGYAWYAAEVH